MRQIIQFQISKSEGFYVANGVDAPIVTQAETLDALAANIQEAVDLYLADENTADFGLVPSPAVLVNFELPTPTYA